MSIVLQWVIVAACLLGAAGYLLDRLGVFALFGWRKARSGGACSACPHCPTAERIATRLAGRE